MKEQDPNHLVTVGEEGFYGKILYPVAHCVLDSFVIGSVVAEKAMLPRSILPCWYTQQLESLHAFSIRGCKAVKMLAATSRQHEAGKDSISTQLRLTLCLLCRARLP